MKEQYIVVGLRIPDDGNTEVIELEIVKPVDIQIKPDFSKVQEAIQNNESPLSLIQQEMQSKKQYRTKVYMSKDWCSKNNITMFSGVTFDFEKGRI